MLPRTWCLLLFVPLAFAADSVRIELNNVSPALIQQRLESVPKTLADRKAALLSLFHEAGCEAVEQPVPHSKKAGNLVCTLPGEGENAIVVGGHYDFIDAGTGAIDDWSGAVMLPSLYQSLNSHPRRHRYVFIAFAAEEDGLYGSQQYVDKLSRPERHNVHAMINLECLGSAPPEVWASRADKGLLAAYAQAAHSLQIEPRAMNVDKVGDDDSHPFLKAGIPVLTIHSVTNATLPFLHNSRDNLTNIHPDDYYAAYRVTATLLALLDTRLE